LGRDVHGNGSKTNLDHFINPWNEQQNPWTVSAPSRIPDGLCNTSQSENDSSFILTQDFYTCRYKQYQDNVSVKVNAIIYFRVIDEQRAILQVEDFLYATQQIAQTTLRSILGQSQLDDLLAKREEINTNLQRIIDQQTEPWGIKVTAVEVKNVDLPQEMVRAIARQAEAERERRAKVIHAEGEFQAAQKLSDSAAILSVHPAAIQLRFLQTLADIATEKNSVTIFPVPIDLLTPFLKRGDKES